MTLIQVLSRDSEKNVPLASPTGKFQKPKKSSPLYSLVNSQTTKHNVLPLIVCVTMLTSAAYSTESTKRDKSSKSNTSNLYFGQKRPSLEPLLFAPGMVSLDGRFESAVSFTPDLKEMYFSAYSEGENTSIHFSNLVDHNWTPVKNLNLTNGQKKTEMHPFVSIDGKTLYFTALNDSFKDENIWYARRMQNTWSKAVKLESPINDGVVFSPNQSKSGDLFYTELSSSGIKTNYAPSIDGTYPDKKNLGIDVGHHAFVSPSQNYLLVTGSNFEDANRNDNDLYVYFKQSEGRWSDPINLGDTINSTSDEVSPRITPDGKYLFFTRDGDVYWVSTEIVNKVRPD